MVFNRRSQSPICNLRPIVGEALPPLLEGPSLEQCKSSTGRKKNSSGGFKSWMKEQIEKTTNNLMGYKRSQIRLLLGVLGTSLGPFPVGKLPPTVSPKDSPIETSSAQYIVQQYIAATGGSKLQNSIHNSYTMGKVKMVLSDFDLSPSSVSINLDQNHSHHRHHNGANAKVTENGCFVLWQMMPDKWYVELAIAGTKVRAGSDAKLVWRHTPWSGSSSSRGPIRPLRRALQGLDPRTIANMFVNARCAGEKKVSGEDCFVLKLTADSYTLAARSNGSEEVIRHIVFGYFSQRTGLLVRMEDSHLTRIQTARGDTMYWEITMETSLDDYRVGEHGISIAHLVKSVVKIYRFGEASMNHSKTQIEETWSVEEAAHNVPGLSHECFIPPSDMKVTSLSEASEFSIEDNYGTEIGASPFDGSVDSILWRPQQ